MNSMVATLTATARISELRYSPVATCGVGVCEVERSDGFAAATSIGVLQR
jgi:hypothetical protein